MTDPREPIRRALEARIANHYVIVKYPGSGCYCDTCESDRQTLAALDALRVVQPGEVVLSAEAVDELEPWVLHNEDSSLTARRILREALLASGPDGGG